MNRQIEFNIVGDIIITTDISKEIVYWGIVLLTSEQLLEAQKYGWVEFGTTVHEFQLGLYRARRDQNYHVRQKPDQQTKT